jgi:hypothetical protein
MSELPHICTVFPDEGPPAIAITGDLRVYPILLADGQGQPLAGIRLATAAHSMSVAIFGRLGVMVQTVRRDDVTMQGPYPAKFSSRNFRADVIEWA